MKQAGKDRRQFERFDKKIKMAIQFAYDAHAKLKYQIEDHPHSKALIKKFSAISRNISANGLCFTSDKRLKKGQNLHLEFYLPKIKMPIHMDGKVRWSGKSSLAAKKPQGFDTGVKLISVDGQPVSRSLYFDKTYHVYWSQVLESVFGTFRKRMQELKSAVSD